MANNEDIFQKVISHSKEYGFIFQSSEIYENGLSAVYDYGQNGAELKKNIREYWWRAMVQLHENIVGIDAAIFMHPTTWKASGHVDAFNDPLIDNKDSKKRYRADVLIEDAIAKLSTDWHKEILKATKKFGESFDLEKFTTTTPKMVALDQKIKGFQNRFKRALEGNNLDELRQIIIDLEIACPICGTRNWTEVRQFNLMFATRFGAIADNDNPPKDKNEAVLYRLYKTGKKSFYESTLEEEGFDITKLSGDGGKFGEYTLSSNLGEILDTILPSMKSYELTRELSDIVYLRPETAQGIFVNFLNVQKTGRMKIPFGIAQTGKAFRNEIVARQFIFRMREFEQMEMQFFVRPGTENEWYEKWKAARMKWHNALGFSATKYRFHDHLKLAHYAKAACDIEFEFPFGFKELEGIHSRSDFDLKQHEQFSGKKLQYFDPELNQSYVPYVIETSIGLDRMFLATLSTSYKEEKLEDGSERVVLNLPAFLAPIKVAIFPLMGKDGLPEKAMEIMDTLKYDHICTYEEKDNIGKRYRRQDAIGTPYCITVDHQTLTDNTVTIRERDTMKQERVAIDQLPKIIGEKVSMNAILRKL
ncbi:MAG TPA: glycine--tRNA ligase [Bacteroidia bacterium]|jgi:glycyl-tRNA synthetase|nr:glycine--tRNA ligase [Bacteroidia bacterium]